MKEKEMTKLKRKLMKKMKSRMTVVKTVERKVMNIKDMMKPKEGNELMNEGKKGEGGDKDDGKEGEGWADMS